MKDIEIIHSIIFNETYNNSVLLDIELDKVQDIKLIIGMLTDLYSKEEYEANKEIAIQKLAEYNNYKDRLVECNQHFIDQMKEYNSKILKKYPSQGVLEKFICILNSAKPDLNDEVDLTNNKDFIDFIKSLSDKDVDYFKNIMLKHELYKELALVDKVR